MQTPPLAWGLIAAIRLQRHLIILSLLSHPSYIQFSAIFGHLSALRVTFLEASNDMSFGYGVGDFLAVAKLATESRRRFGTPLINSKPYAMSEH